MGAQRGSRRGGLPALDKELAHKENCSNHPGLPPPFVQTPGMLELFPETARIHGGELSLGGVLRLAARRGSYGTPLLVYCEAEPARPGAGLSGGRAGRARLLRHEGVRERRAPASARRGGDRRRRVDARRARVRPRGGTYGERLLFHGNNKSDEELRAAAEAGATVVLDAPDEPERAAAAGVRRVLVRLTPGVEAVTHQAIATAHDESKFGLGADDALAAIQAGRSLGLDVAGIHFHVGSQLEQIDESLLAVDRLAAFCDRAAAELGWSPTVVDLGGSASADNHESIRLQSPTGCGRSSPAAQAPPSPAQVAFEPGRSLVSRAGVSLYRVGVVKESGGARTPRSTAACPRIRGRSSTAPDEALLAERADELATGVYRVAGKQCESGDVLIDAAELPRPRRGDLLAVPATGAYTLSLSSNYTASRGPRSCSSATAARP